VGCFRDGLLEVLKGGRGAGVKYLHNSREDNRQGFPKEQDPSTQRGKKKEPCPQPVNM